MTKQSDSNSYSLENLEMWVTDAIESDCKSDEIYNTLLEVVTQNMRYHKACFSTSVKLYSKLKGSTTPNVEVFDGNDTSDRARTEWSKFWEGDLAGEEFKIALKKYGYEYTPPTDEEYKRFKLDSPFLHEDVDLDE